MSIDITHFTVEEGGEFFPAAEFIPGDTVFNVLRFADGRVWDRTVGGWRDGRLFPRVPSERTVGPVNPGTLLWSSDP